MPILYPFSKSAEVIVTAQKKPTSMRIYLWDINLTERMEEKTVYTGTKIVIRVGIFSPLEGNWITNRDMHIWHRVDTGAWEKLAIVGTAGDTFDYSYELTTPGIHTFYVEFLGDSLYEGCKKAAKTFAR